MNLKLEFIKRINTTKNSIFYSLIRYKDEILGFARNHNNKREIKKIKLDDNFNIIEDNCNEIDLIKGEDPRCFIYYNKLYILDNYIDDMYLYDYEDNKYIKLLIDGKNPSFIIHNNEIYIIYWITPFILYKLNINTGEVEKIEVEDTNKILNYENRGGTPGYKIDDNTYYGFAHRTYYENEILKHDIFKWIVYFENDKLPKISIINIEKPEKSKNITDPTSVIEINNELYLVTAESDDVWFNSDQDFITNVYKIKE